MPTVNPGTPYTNTLRAGATLTVAVPAGGLALVERTDAAGTIQKTSVVAGTSTTIGPFLAAAAVRVSSFFGPVEVAAGVVDAGGGSSYSDAQALAAIAASYPWIAAGAVPLRGNNYLAIAGDSHLALGRASGTSNDDRYVAGLVNWALGLSDFRLEPVTWAAVSGARITDTGGSASLYPVVKQIDTCIAGVAGHLLLEGGVNDITGGVSLDAIKTGYMQIIGKAIAAGMRVWWCTIPPIADANYTVAVMGKIMAMNDWIRQKCITDYSSRNVVLVDIHSAYVEPTSATGAYKTNYSADNLHVRNIGAYFGGKLLASLWTQNVPAQSFLLESATDQYGYSNIATNLLDNGLFLASTNNLATGFSQTNSNATITNSIIADPDGFGNRQQMAIAATTSGNARLTSGNVASRLLAGASYYASCRVSVQGGASLSGVRLGLNTQGSAGAFNATFMQNVANQLPLVEDFTITMRTPRVDTSVLGTMTTVQAQLTCDAIAAGNSTVTVGRMSIRQVQA